jgi:flagellar motor switch protein FliN/FliY
MSALDGVTVEMTVVLGSTWMPIRQVLKMGRGAMIALDCGYDDPSELHVNGVPIAHGKLSVSGDRIALEITDMIAGAR